ncbi:hypothetical protein A5320_12040 [Rheinheimera sp. SA_1]|nr:hypothetical protein A5320_12040 [Rheinheimera sp. SA_1]
MSKIQESGIKIIWESPKTIMTRVFGFDLEDTDVEATRKMMDEIVLSKNYQDLKDVRFNLGGEDYTLETFIEYDYNFSLSTKSVINSAISVMTKEQRKEERDLDLTPCLVQLRTEIMLRDFILNQLGAGSTIDDPRYSRALAKYSNDDQINIYLKAIVLGISKALSESQLAGANDGFDYGHLIYASRADYFVSDDKFYKRIKPGFFDISFITGEEYINMCGRGIA